MRHKKIALCAASVIALLQPGTTGAGNCNSSQEPPTYDQAMELENKTNTPARRAKKNSRQNRSEKVQEIHQPPVDYPPQAHLLIVQALYFWAFKPNEDYNGGFKRSRIDTRARTRAYKQVRKEYHTPQWRSIECANWGPGPNGEPPYPYRSARGYYYGVA